MRVRDAFILLVLLSSACSGSTPVSPLDPLGTGPMTGTWVGSAGDSTGSMMGGGQTSAMMNSTTWTLTQSGTGFTGSIQFPGYSGGRMDVSGVMNGGTGAFTMTMLGNATGTMMMSSRCSATASGTFEMDEAMTRFHGTYQGSNSCTGPFGQGTIAMRR